MKKRVLQFIGSFHQGGSERQAVGLCRLLKRDETFEVEAVTLNNEGILRPEMDAIGLHEIPEFRLTSFFDLNFIHQVRKCARYLRARQIDIIHTHDFYTNVFGMTAASLAGVKVRVASKRETSGMRSRGQDVVEKLAFAQASAIVVNSESVRGYLHERGIRASKLNLIYNGLDLSRFDTRECSDRYFREMYRLPAGGSERFITLVANLRHDVKNIPMLLRAVRPVVSQHPDTHVIVAGEGELESELRAAAKNLGVAGNVHFIGRCTDVPLLLKSSYACVLTSKAEGFSNSILEYMAAGKAVVATNVGGAAEAVVDGSSGYLIASEDDETLAAKLIDLLSDEGKANQFGAEGRRIVGDKFSENSQLQNTIQLYNSLLNDQ